MSAWWKDFSRWLEDASKVLSKEAGDLTMKGKLKLEIFELKRRLQEHYKELGMEVFEQLERGGGDIKKNDFLKGMIRKIKRIKKEIKDKETEYKKIGGEGKMKGG
uniref:Uncharacterized protein n=1 Tax=candidate division WOR-3 bacterium TaxID=2052148 RepID=A0A7C4XFZ6_UNCW3